MSVTAPDATGKVTATIDYNFPAWLSGSNRALSLYLDGAQVGFTNPGASSGTWTRTVSLACARTGNHTFTTYATSCQKWGQSGYSASSSQAVFASTKPDVTLTLSPPAANGDVVATYAYSFPNTSAASQRAVSLWVDGQQVSYLEPGGQTGTLSKTLQTRCWTTGAHLIDAAATSCKMWNDFDYQDVERQTILIDGPTIDITPLRGEIDPATNRRKIEVTVAYSLGASASTGTLVVNVAEWREADGTLTTGGNLITKTLTASAGTEVVQLTPPNGAQQVHFTGYITTGETPASCGRTATDDAWVECTTCADASANPVYYTDGNMRLNDSEALPPVAGMTQDRVYNSDEQIVGLFGRGWTTLFDRRLYDDGTTVSLSLDTNEAVTFRNSGGAFVQVWPTARRDAGTLKLDTAASAYVYRAPGSQQAVVFRASDGRLIAYRDLRTGREAQVGYDAQGLPQLLTDSWTGVSWILTLNATQRTVASIAVSGRPDLVWTYSYDASGNLTSVLAPGNAPWRTYEYAANRMTASYDALGNLIESHTYDANGFATSSTGDVDEIASIVYNLSTANPGERLTRVTHRSGAVVDHVLARSGSAYRSNRVVGGCAGCGSRDTTSARDGQGRVIRIQRADGYIDTTTYSGTRVIEERRHLHPAGCDPETSPTHCRLESAALATATLVPTASAITTTYTYGDPNWPERPTEVSIPSVAQPGQSRKETFVYDAATGIVTTHTISGWTGSPAQSQSQTTTTSLYNGTEGATFTPGGAFAAAWLTLPQPAGGRKTIDGRRTDVQDVSAFVYYPVHADVPALLRGHLAATKNAAGHITRFEDYDVFGNAASIVDPSGVATTLTVDALGRVLTSTLEGLAGCNTMIDPLCATDLTTSRTYASVSGPLQSEQRPGGGVTSHTYDSRGRVRTIARGPSTTDSRESIEYSYDAGTGKKSLERVLAREGTTWVEKKRESFTYDTLGQLQTITHADDTTTGYTYDAEGRLATMRDERHQTANTRNSYDPAGRLIAVDQTLSAGSVQTRYGYDLHGNLTSVTDPNQNVTIYVYDDFGRMLAQTSPVTGMTAYAYDLAGNLTSVTDANAATTARTHDAAGRVLTAVSTRTGRPAESITWTYDGPSFGTGRLSTMSDVTGTTAYTYDRRGLLLSEARTFTGVAPSTVTSFGYDVDGNRSRIVYPSGTQAVYAFDFGGRPLSVSFGGTSVVSNATYRPFGPLTSIAFGNGTTQTMEYDQRYLITMNRLSGPAGVLARYSYGHDQAGNVTAIADDVDATYSRTFGYDDLSRLVTADSGTSLWRLGGYTYDAMGNMQSLELGDRESVPMRRQLYFAYEGTTPKLATVRTNNLPSDPGEPLLRIGTQEYGGYRTMTYDAAGNETNYAVARTYSARNLLSGVEEPSELPGWQHRLDYGYDGRGIRVVRTESGMTPTPATRYYTYLPELRLLSTTEDDGATVRDEFVWFGDRPVAQISPERSTAPEPELSRLRPTAHTASRPLYTTFADHLGTPILQTDSTAAITWRAEYEPYGDIWLMRTGRASDQPLRFPGQEAAMGWEGGEENYNVFRWYRAGWGRYTQADPLDSRVPGVNNGYRYALSNPQRWIDPKGLESTHTSDILTCASNPANCVVNYKCKEEAIKVSKQKFGYEKDGSPQNAYKHCYWNCCMAKQIGAAAAKDISGAHENYAGNPPCSKDMDQWNNEMGSMVMGSASCDQHCSSAPLQNASKCDCKYSPWDKGQWKPAPPTAPQNCAWANGQYVCAGTGI